MKKGTALHQQIVMLVGILLISGAPLCATNTTQNNEWSFSKWVSEGFQKTMERMEGEFKKLKTELAKIKIFGPKTKTWHDEKTQKYHIQVELPGYQDIKVTAKIGEKQQELEIQASKEVETVTEGKKTVEMKEFSWSETLQADARPREATWTYKDGLLKIEVPSKAKKKVEVIEIKESKK